MVCRRDGRAHVGHVEGRGRSGTVLRRFRYQRDESEVFDAGVARRRAGVWGERTGDDSERRALSFSATRGLWNLRRGEKRLIVTVVLLVTVLYYLVPGTAAHTEIRYVLPMHAMLTVFAAARGRSAIKSCVKEMNTDARSISNPLPREMMEHTYPILYAVEQSHWWYIGRRRITRRICRTDLPSGD